MEDSVDRSRKVAIVGSSDTTRHLAPYGDESWEIWTLNDMHTIAPRMTRLFELDPVIELPHYSYDFHRNNTVVPIWMMFPQDDFPAAVQYPHEVIVKEFGRYFTSSISWMLALAIYEGVDEIALYGVDMAHSSEYGHQRPSCEYFIGLARGKGIPVSVPEQSELLKARRMYALEFDTSLPIIVRRRDQLIRERDAAQQQKTQAMFAEAERNGGIEMLNYVISTWS